MPIIAFHQVVDADREQQVRQRYASDITEFSEVGFEWLCLHDEHVSWLYSLIWFPIFSAMRKKNEVVIRKPWGQIVAYYPLLVCRPYATYLQPSGLGVKFYTGFTDGTLIISGSSGASEVRTVVKHKLYKYSFPVLPKSVWEIHCELVNKMRADGKQTRSDIGFEAYRDFAQLETSVVFPSD